MTQARFNIPVYVGLVTVDRILDLRHRVLLAGLPVESARFEADLLPQTTHYGAFLLNGKGNPKGEPVCCASFALKFYNKKPAWQLRGMATDERYRGCNVGAQVLSKAEQELCSNSRYAHIKIFWCNARSAAVNFYKKNGWQVCSGVFDIPTAGPHHVMTKTS